MNSLVIHRSAVMVDALRLVRDLLSRLGGGEYGVSDDLRGIVGTRGLSFFTVAFPFWVLCGDRTCQRRALT